MLKREVEFFIVDILITINKIKRMMHKIDTVDVFVANECVFDAVMRELEVLGEASNHLLKDEKIAPLISNEWRKIVGLRNIIIHEYFGIDADVIFDAIRYNVPEFEVEVIALAKKIKNGQWLKIAIEDSKKMLLRMKRFESIKYLEKVADLIFDNGH
jgi:uncharacterized protein with HEPN domain